MLWDSVILVLAVVLAVNGWNRGLLRSWRGPIAIVLATLITQHFYIDFSTWIMSRLRINPENSVIVGYLMLWFSLEAVLEIVLSMLLKSLGSRRPVFFDRLAGVAYGLAKSVVIVVLPLMAVSVPLKIPEPPADKSGLAVPDFAENASGSYLVPGFSNVAQAMVPLLGNYVVSYAAPSFTPTYSSGSEEADNDSGKPKFNKEDLKNLLK